MQAMMSPALIASKRKSVRVQQQQIKRFKEYTIGSSTHTAGEENKENAAPRGKMAQRVCATPTRGGTASN